MEMDKEYIKQLEIALEKKQEWFNNERLQELLEHYRLFFTCIKNLNELLAKKSLIVPDPYKLDRRISDIIVTDTSTFLESEIPTVLGARLCEFESMLDFICIYFRFSVSSFTIDKIKKLLEMNKFIDWANISVNNTNCNTRSLAMVMNQAKKNATAVVLSTLNDSIEKCAVVTSQINTILNQLSAFQKEMIKAKLRKDIFEHPDFNREKAFSSFENEISEIKKVFVKVYGKKTFYTDLVNEIVKEDQSAEREELKKKVLKSLEITQKVVKKEKSGPTAKDLLMEAIVSLNGFSPVLYQLHSKLFENFDLMFSYKKTFFAKLLLAIKKAFGAKEKVRIFNIQITDAKTGSKITKKINVGEFLADLEKKAKIYNKFVINSDELERFKKTDEDTVLIFLNKQISENQQIYSIINELDTLFKNNVELLLRPKVKGLKIDLSSYKNLIITVNKKRGEYISVREENEQMKKLGIVNDEK